MPRLKFRTFDPPRAEWNTSGQSVVSTVGGAIMIESTLRFHATAAADAAAAPGDCPAILFDLEVQLQ